MDKVELIKKIKAGMEFEYLFFWGLGFYGCTSLMRVKLEMV